METFVSQSVQDTERFAAALASRFNGGEVVAFTGGMGAGKTAFVRGLAAGLGADGQVSSPTFAIVNEYKGRLRILHYDMYRIDGYESLLSTGFFDEAGAPDTLTLIEWSENIRDELPLGCWQVEISPGAGEEERVIRVEEGGI